MENFIIGQYGHFDEKKFNKDFRESFWGIEACMFESEEAIEQLLACKNKYQLELGVHFPLRKGIWSHRDPQYLSKDNKIREASFKYMEKEFDYLEKLEPDYVLIHYPKPVILDSRTDWHNLGWRFSHESEYTNDCDYDMITLKEKSHEFFSWFEQQSSIKGFRGIIELDNIPPLLYETTLLEELLSIYDIGLCVDIGRFHLQDMIDEHFCAKSYLKKIAKHVEEIHLWNVQVSETINNGHYPALPSLKKEDGWADVSEYLSILNEKVRYKILFEHQSHAITDTQLQEVYEWIDHLYHRR